MLRPLSPRRPCLVNTATANGQRGRGSRVIPSRAVLLPQQPSNCRRPRDCIDRCKRRTPRASLGSWATAWSPGPGRGRPARPGRVLCKGSGGLLRVAFLVIRVAFLAVERRGSECGVGAVSGGVSGVGGRSGSVVGGGAFAMAFLGRFGRHTFALKCPPSPRGVRVHRIGGPGPARAAGVNASDRCCDNDQSRCLSLEVDP